MAALECALPTGANLGERYYPAFDGIRAVAACLVFIDHYGGLPYFGHGVSVFFVLSGFLITGVLYDARDTLKRFRTFYIRRSLRIFPVYYAFWILMLVMTPLLHVQWNRGNLLYLVYAGNHIWGMFTGPVQEHMDLVHLVIRPFSFSGHAHRLYMLYVAHFWTLSVEEQFYLMWPLVVFNVRSRTKLLRICAATIAAVFALRVVCVVWLPEHMNLISHLTLLRCDEFLLGGGAALYLRGPNAERLLRQGENLFVIGMTGLTVSLCLITFYLSALHEMQVSFTFQTAMVDVAALGALLMAMQERTWMARALSWAPLRALGRISYGFYVFHDIPHNLYVRAVSLASARLPFGINEDAAVAVLAFVCTVTMAALSYKFLERPFLQLKNKWGVAGVRAAHKEAVLVEA